MGSFKRTTENPRKEDSNKKKVFKKKRQRKRFLQVDVWQKKFGPISVRAVFDVFSQKFQIHPKDLNKYSFSDCVNALRLLEDPEYVAPRDTL